MIRSELATIGRSVFQSYCFEESSEDEELAGSTCVPLQKPQSEEQALGNEHLFESTVSEVMAAAPAPSQQ